MTQWETSEIIKYAHLSCNVLGNSLLSGSVAYARITRDPW